MRIADLVEFDRLEYAPMPTQNDPMPNSAFDVLIAERALARPCKNGLAHEQTR